MQIKLADQVSLNEKTKLSNLGLLTYVDCSNKIFCCFGFYSMDKDSNFLSLNSGNNGNKYSDRALYQTIQRQMQYGPVLIFLVVYLSVI